MIVIINNGNNNKTNKEQIKEQLPSSRYISKFIIYYSINSFLPHMLLFYSFTFSLYFHSLIIFLKKVKDFVKNEISYMNTSFITLIQKVIIYFLGIEI